MERETDGLRCSLKDCGFETEDTERYLEYAEEHRAAEQLRLLNRQRRKLMDELHMVQKQVDVVDFMIYSVKQDGFDKIESFPRENLK